MSDIFISYARADRKRLRRFVRVLEQQGWSVWWDPNILPGESWRHIIQSALGEASCVLVVWSQSSINSSWVLSEAEEGKKAGILVPLMIDNVPIPLGFRDAQTADLAAWNSKAMTDDANAELNHLLTAIAAKLNRPASSHAPFEALRLFRTTVPHSIF